MGAPFLPLTVAALVWFAIHPGIAGSRLRSLIVERSSDGAFRALFALLSIASLGWLIHAYSQAPTVFVWVTPPALLHVPLLLVPLAFVFLVGAFTVPNPTSVGGEKNLAREEPARGMLRITRHPFLWAVMIWAFAHILVNGDIASLLFFGSLGLTALVGTRDIDKKRARSSGDQWQRFVDVTSNIPFVAIAAGRNRLAMRELILPLVLGLVVALAMLMFHRALFGVSPLPSGS